MRRFCGGGSCGHTCAGQRAGPAVAAAPAHAEQHHSDLSAHAFAGVSAATAVCFCAGASACGRRICPRWAVKQTPPASLTVAMFSYSGIHFCPDSKRRTRDRCEDLQGNRSENRPRPNKARLPRAEAAAEPRLSQRLRPSRR